MVTLVYSAVHTNRSALLIGAAITDVPSGTIRTLAALQTQLTALGALIAIRAIG